MQLAAAPQGVIAVVTRPALNEKTPHGACITLHPGLLNPGNPHTLKQNVTKGAPYPKGVVFFRI
jgi:hypothetical protein